MYMPYCICLTVRSGQQAGPRRADGLACPAGRIGVGGCARALAVFADRPAPGSMRLTTGWECPGTARWGRQSSTMPVGPARFGFVRSGCLQGVVGKAQMGAGVARLGQSAQRVVGKSGELLVRQRAAYGAAAQYVGELALCVVGVVLLAQASAALAHEVAMPIPGVALVFVHQQPIAGPAAGRALRQPVVAQYVEAGVR